MPRIYYFVVMDCEHNTHAKVRTMPKIEVEFEITSNINGQESHFSYEEQGLLVLHLALFAIFAILFGLTIYSYMWFHKTFDRYDSPHFVIILALFFQMSGIFMDFLHLWMYSYNGRGIPIFDIFSIISYMMSEITFSSLFMMLAYGWTISF